MHGTLIGLLFAFLVLVFSGVDDVVDIVNNSVYCFYWSPQNVAFTLANGFTYVEAYLARGMKIDDFAPNLSFF